MTGDSKAKYEIWVLTDEGYRLIIVNTPKEGQTVMKQFRRTSDVFVP